MIFINKVANEFNFEIDNNVNDLYNVINNGSRNLSYIKILNQFKNLNNEAQYYSSINYLVYLILSTFTHNTHHTYNEMLDVYLNNNINETIKNFVDEGYIKYLTQGDIKNIILILTSLTNNNNSLYNTNKITDILDVLSNEQLFVLLNMRNMNDSTPFINNLFSNSCILYNIYDIYGNDYYNIHYNFEYGNIEKDNQINYLHLQYDNNNKVDYFHFAINKLFNSNYGVTNLNNNTGMTYNQLAFCLYYINNATLNLDERFSKFVNILTLQQLTYIGV